MLKPGQKVKVSNACREKDTKITDKLAGQITTIIKYELDSKNPKIGGYYSVVGSIRYYPRTALFPIDDEPCDDEFLEYFKDILNENRNYI